MKYFDTDAAAYASIMQMAAADANLMVHTVRSLDAAEADPAAAPSISNAFLHTTRKGNGKWTETDADALNENANV